MYCKSEALNHAHISSINHPPHLFSKCCYASSDIYARIYCKIKSSLFSLLYSEVAMETDIIQFLMFLLKKKPAYIFSSATIATLDIVRAICKDQVTIATLTIQAVSQIMCPGCLLVVSGN